MTKKKLQLVLYAACLGTREPNMLTYVLAGIKIEGFELKIANQSLILELMYNDLLGDYGVSQSVSDDILTFEEARWIQQVLRKVSESVAESSSPPLLNYFIDPTKEEWAIVIWETIELFFDSILGDFDESIILESPLASLTLKACAVYPDVSLEEQMYQFQENNLVRHVLVDAETEDRQLVSIPLILSPKWTSPLTQERLKQGSYVAPGMYPGCNMAVDVAVFIDDKVLVVDRKDGNMALPGGKVERYEESTLEAAIRELFEETGLVLDEEELTSVDVFFCDEDRSYYPSSWICTRLFRVDVQPEAEFFLADNENDSARNPRFVPVEEACELLWEHHKNLLQRALEGPEEW